MSGPIILPEKVKAFISKETAYCLLVELPTRRVATASGLYAGEIPRHWERVTSDGHVVRCHTYIEALNAREILSDYVEAGQFLRVEIQPYDPSPTDLPYWQWIRGMRGKVLGKLGIREEDLPEHHDPSLTRITDDDWLERGPR